VPSVDAGLSGLKDGVKVPEPVGLPETSIAVGQEAVVPPVRVPAHVPEAALPALPEHVPAGLHAPVQPVHEPALVGAEHAGEHASGGDGGGGAGSTGHGVGHDSTNGADPDNSAHQAGSGDHPGSSGAGHGASGVEPTPGGIHSDIVDPTQHLGPSEIDHSQPGGHLIPDSYDPRGGLTQDEFLARHWNPGKVNWDGSFGGWDYPPHDGFDVTPGAPPPHAVDLPQGYRFDRFGGTSGDFVSPEGTAFPARGIPPDSLNKPYHLYELIRPFDDLSGRPIVGRIAEAFEQPGGSVQFKLPKSVQWLLDNDYIKEVRP
jgi:hypothetical protein